MLLSVAHKLLVLNTLERILVCIVMSKMLKHDTLQGSLLSFSF